MLRVWRGLWVSVRGLAGFRGYVLGIFRGLLLIVRGLAGSAGKC